MTEQNPLYFKQLLSGVDVGSSDSSAQQMANFIYLIGDRSSRECVIVDPAWDIDGILNVIETDEMQLKGSLVTHSHPKNIRVAKLKRPTNSSSIDSAFEGEMVKQAA